MADVSPSRITEQALLLGPRRALVGVSTSPASGTPLRDVTVVILNSGIIHRVGANRIHVQLARDLAEIGFRVVRFDLSGIGDSPKRQEAQVSLLDAVMADIREVADQVAGAGGKVVLLGLCSGAAHALLYAGQDARVVGLVLMDLWIPPTRRYYWKRAWNSLKGRRGWMNLLSGRNQLVQETLRAARHRLSRPVATGQERPAQEQAHDFAAQPDAHQGRKILAELFHRLIDRRVPMLTVFTAGLQDQHNYGSQLLDAFPDLDFHRCVRVSWFPESDHSFTADVQRGRLRRLVVEWASSETFRRSALAP